MSSSSFGQRRAAREGFPSSPRLFERRRRQQEQQQTQAEEEEDEDDNKNEDDTGAESFALKTSTKHSMNHEFIRK